ncbi:ABC transporter substrate-binding protein [Desulfopila sp. IMCC35008]|uniref:ABC transporter substrate-binding protein n=1 Tax=Desulfopila sp. IMCC35008 TaxID=2653858 RepID=UPI0013D42566|nr:extracellular solute-binding protein [Desulfopila sp. IMCC35008]
MNRIITWTIFLMITVPVFYNFAGAAGTDTPETPTITEQPKQLKQIILTMGSWRKDDVEQVNVILHKFTEKYPHIVIKFDPTSPADYNDVIEAQLESGTAPDLFYLRSFSYSKKLFKKGYLSPLNDLTEIKKSFPQQMLEAWSTPEGALYGIPLMAVSHGIYYNSSFFKEMNIAIPDTWEQLLALAEQIKQQGIVPFANATGDAWTVNGLILQNVIPNIIGGIEGRLAYYNGDRCFDDEQMVASFQAVKDIAPYVSENQKLLKYADSLQLFIQGKSPMWFGGSWDIPFFEEQSPEFEWSVFAIPPPEGKKYYVTFHPDAGIGLNASSQYIEEAKLFLQWMATSEFASLLIEHLPGFFPMHNDITVIKNKHARVFLGFNDTYQTDSRFVWGKIRDGEPSAYEISLQSSIEVMNNLITPEQAAKKLQAGLSQWYEPAKRCTE